MIGCACCEAAAAVPARARAVGAMLTCYPCALTRLHTRAAVVGVCGDGAGDSNNQQLRTHRQNHRATGITDTLLPPLLLVPPAPTTRLSSAPPLRLARAVDWLEV